MGRIRYNSAVRMENIWDDRRQDRGELLNNPDDSLKWKFKVGNSGIVSSPLVDGNETIYIGSAGENIFFAVDSLGQEKWRFTISGSLQSSPALGPSGTIYFQSHYPSYLLAIGQGKK